MRRFYGTKLLWVLLCGVDYGGPVDSPSAWVNCSQGNWGDHQSQIPTGGFTCTSQLIPCSATYAPDYSRWNGKPPQAVNIIHDPDTAGQCLLTISWQ